MKIEDVKLPDDVIAWVNSKSYAVFDSKPWELNIVGIRRKDGISDNRVFVVCKDDKEALRMWKWSVTTDPGFFWLQSAMNIFGGGSLVPGQYLDCWQLGFHNGKPSLKQVKTVKTYRGINKDVVIDIDPAMFSEDLRGTNVRRSERDSQSTDRWSAGCQVFLREDDFRDFMDLCGKQLTSAKSSSFSYTLLEED
jgi:hypothetical protein